MFVEPAKLRYFSNNNKENSSEEATAPLPPLFVPKTFAAPRWHGGRSDRAGLWSSRSESGCPRR
jgi:hypothetical protein